MIYFIIYLIGVVIMVILSAIAVFRKKKSIPEGSIPVMIASFPASWLAIIAIFIGYLYGIKYKDQLKKMENK